MHDSESIQLRKSEQAMQVSVLQHSELNVGRKWPLQTQVQVRVQQIGQRSCQRLCLKIAKKFCLYLDIFSWVKINVFRSFFTFKQEMHVRCDNQCKTGADGGTILGQPMLFECMSIRVLSPAHESEMRGSLVYVLIVKNLSHWFCLKSTTVY